MAILSYLLTGLTSYLTLTVSLYGLSLKLPRAGFFARCLASYACLIACASYGVVASIALRLVGYGGISQYAVGRSFKWAMRLSTGSRFEIISGAEHLTTRPAVFISNHQTELDVLMLGSMFPPYCSVTAKKSLARVPFLGWFMTLSGTVFIDRANRETALKAFDGAAEQMRRERQSVFIFPEGTRSYSDQPCLLPFKKGAFHLAVKAGVDIVPVVVENYAHLLNVKQLRFDAGAIRVKVLPPISTKNLQSSDVDELTRNARESMLEVIQELYQTRPTAQIAAGSSSGNPIAMPAQASSSAVES
ncbi:1-acylglycerol-3-phosphate O-acyltransferase [Onygenales sp. PD_12]|nr:1-acylglycerol-3-phosphate O-acyltransferase [Emmonsiellopsis sp. PD_33]KAK2791252.1 1-acylglycerol-3-phosphate O-acyltransferase [Onygenales sp. PD_12]KAK2791755.1 1-acylglycerol-3-phosphate O-acyltransferase [Onygenales sp. PD_10]